MTSWSNRALGGSLALLAAGCDTSRCLWAEEDTSYTVTLGEKTPPITGLEGTCGDDFDLVTGDRFSFHTRDSGAADCDIRAPANFPQVRILGDAGLGGLPLSPIVVFDAHIVQVNASCSGYWVAALTAGQPVNLFRAFHTDDPESCVVPGSTIAESGLDDRGGGCNDTWFVRVVRSDGNVVVDFPK